MQYPIRACVNGVKKLYFYYAHVVDGRDGDIDYVVNVTAACGSHFRHFWGFVVDAFCAGCDFRRRTFQA
jgi:hypothetical protein